MYRTFCLPVALWDSVLLAEEGAPRRKIAGAGRRPSTPQARRLSRRGRKAKTRTVAKKAQRAKDRGVTVCIEPEPGLLIEKGGEYEEFVTKYVDFSAVGLNFDMGHFYCVGEDPAALIRGVGRKALHFHLEDIAADRVHFHLPPGEGAMDFDAIFASLREIKYDGWVTIELYPFQEDAPGVAKRAYDRIKPYLG